MNSTINKHSTEPFWEHGYAQSDKTFNDGKPAEEILHILNLLSANASVLDIGCGDGRNSLFLSRKGFNVTAIDISESGISRVKKVAASEDLKINIQKIDACQFSFSRNYDLIIAWGVLHLISKEERKQLLSRMKRFTADNGFNLVLVFTNLLPPPDDLKQFMVGLFEEQELFDAYSDWETIKKHSFILDDKHPGGIKHSHPVNKIICRKHFTS